MSTQRNRSCNTGNGWGQEWRHTRGCYVQFPRKTDVNQGKVFSNLIIPSVFSVANIWAAAWAKGRSGCWFRLVLEFRLVLSAVKETVLPDAPTAWWLSQEESEFWWKTTGKGWNTDYVLPTGSIVMLLWYHSSLITTLLSH